MKIDLNKKVLLLDGTETKETYGALLANILAGEAKKIPVLKAFNWALALHKGDPIDIDSTDCDLLKDFVDRHPHITILVQGPILKTLEKAKELAEKKASK